MSYQEYLSKLAKEFDEIKFTHIRKYKNQFVDVVTTLTFMVRVNYRNKV
jgi:hypothetical protein